MKTSWLDGLDPDQQKILRGDFKSSLVVRKRLTEMLNKKIDAKRIEARNKVNYELNNWSEYIADGFGYERALVEIISLLEDSEK